MTSRFSRSLRSLEADGFLQSLPALLLVLLLVAAWLSWFLLARVSVYAITDVARVEANQAVHPLQAPVPGRVVLVHMKLGEEVQAGDVLVELDSQAQRLELEEERTRLEALKSQLEALGVEVSSLQRARSEASEAAAAALDEAEARRVEAEAAARYAEQDAERARQLHAQGHLSETELSRATAETEQRRAAAQAVRVGVDRLRKESNSDASDRQARIGQLERERAALQGHIATSTARMARLEEEIEKRHVRAYVSGRIGEVTNLQVGEVVDEFQRLGAVIPDGDLRILADYAPPVAIGRIRPGQPARMRLNGFPWTQYGSITARVVRIATEARHGQVQVELEVLPDPSSPAPLQHGLPGSVEVEVEKASPATLALRAAGRLLARPAVGSQRAKAAGA
jgi:membrane fusion protein (multidrug efflux system)